MDTLLEILRETLGLELAPLDLVVLLLVVGGLITYIVCTMALDKYREKQLHSFFDWLNKVSSHDVIQLYRNTDNYDKFNDFLITEAIKHKIIDNRHYLNWRDNRGPQLLWADMKPLSKLRAQ